jgi:hypothetical protein
MRLRLKHMSKQQQYSEADFDPTLYGGRDDEDDPIRGWFEEEEDDEMELDQPGDPPRPNEAIARELEIDPDDFAQREYAHLHKGRQPREDDNLGGSSRPSRRRRRSPTPAASDKSTTSCSSDSDDSNGDTGGHALDAQERSEDTFVPSTEFTYSNIPEEPSSRRQFKMYSRSRGASGPRESSAGLSRSTSVSSGKSSALQSGWSKFRSGLRSFGQSSIEHSTDYGSCSQPDEAVTSPTPSESNAVYEPQIPSQAYSGWSGTQEVFPSHEEYQASDYLLQYQPSLPMCILIHIQRQPSRVGLQVNLIHLAIVLGTCSHPLLYIHSTRWTPTLTACTLEVINFMMITLGSTIRFIAGKTGFYLFREHMG